MLLYLLPTIGVTVSAHFCEGKLKSLSFNPFDVENRCSCGSKKMKKDCCKDETTTIKLDENQKKPQLVFFDLPEITDVNPVVSTYLTFDYQTPLLSVGFAYGMHPPDDVKHPLYIRHRVFQI